MMLVCIVLCPALLCFALHSCDRLHWLCSTLLLSAPYTRKPKHGSLPPLSLSSPLPLFPRKKNTHTHNVLQMDEIYSLLDAGFPYGAPVANSRYGCGYGYGYDCLIVSCHACRI